MFSGALADGGTECVQFGQDVDGGPDLVSLALGQHLEHAGRSEPAERAVRARISGAGDPLSGVGAEDRCVEQSVDDLLVGGVAARPGDVTPVAGQVGQSSGGVLGGFAGYDGRARDVLDEPVGVAGPVAGQVVEVAPGVGGTNSALIGVLIGPSWAASTIAISAFTAAS